MWLATCILVIYFHFDTLFALLIITYQKIWNKTSNKAEAEWHLFLCTLFIMNSLQKFSYWFHFYINELKSFKLSLHYLIFTTSNSAALKLAIFNPKIRNENLTFANHFYPGFSVSAQSKKSKESLYSVVQFGIVGTPLFINRGLSFQKLFQKGGG